MVVDSFDGRKEKNTVVVVAPSSLFSLIANKGGVNVFLKESLNARFKTFLKTKLLLFFNSSSIFFCLSLSHKTLPLSLS